MNEMTPPGAARVIPTLDTLTDSQIAAIRAIPPHHESAIPSMLERRSIDIFTGQERYDLEQREVFLAEPVPMSLSAVIPEAGSAVAIDSYGRNVILTRAKDGVVRAFINACSHKGSKLIEDNDPHKTARLICPYHAWTFSLTGKVLGVPRIETFGGLCKDDRPLIELACEEKGGVIWVGQQRDRDYDFAKIEPQVIEDFGALNLAGMHLYGRKLFDLKANWKLVLEPFLEGYHVQRLHAKSVGPMFADVPSTVTRYPRAIRQTSGKAKFAPEMLDVPGENIHKLITHAYQVFPNLVVVTSPYYISVMILAPRAPDRTIVDYMMLTREAPDNPKAEELFERSYRMILDVFGNEDFRAAEISQSGLSSGGYDDVIYCGFEDNIPAFYEILEKAMGLPAEA